MQDTQEFLKRIMEKDDEIELRGKCHDCGVSVVGTAYNEGGKITTDIPFWHLDDLGAFSKCEACYEKNPHLTNYQPTEIFSRVCGYVRPIKQYNPGKQAEKAMRVDYSINEKELMNESKTEETQAGTGHTEDKVRGGDRCD